MEFCVCIQVGSSQVVKYSVIIPFFNANVFINETLRSVISQTIPPSEILIVVDHGSETPVLECPVMSDISVRVLMNETVSRGAGICRNVGVSNARSDIIAFVDADDIWMGDKMEKQLDFMQSYALDFVFSSFFHFFGSQRYNIKTPQFVGTLTEKKILAKHFTIGCLTVVCKKKLFNDIKEPSLFRRNDYQMWVYLLRRNPAMSFGAVEDVLAGHRLHNESLSKNKLKAAMDQLRLLSTLDYANRDKIILMFQYLLFTSLTRIIAKFKG